MWTGIYNIVHRHPAQRAVLPDTAAMTQAIAMFGLLMLVAAPDVRATEVPPDVHAPKIDGHPLTAIVVTQCNLIVAVYMTMPDGRLLRFDKSAHIPSDELMSMAYAATRSERIEVSCNEIGAAGFERHDPV
jgi:hypothetical protein